MLPKLRSFTLGLAFCLAGIISALAADEEMKFDVKGENPGGQAGYTGEVTVTKLGKSTGKIRWVTGTNKEVTEGVAIRTDSAIGAGYGGESLYALAVYELKGKTIQAVWTTAAKPAESDTYTLKGGDFKGACTFADGTPGTVTFTPGKGGMYKVTWDLQVGHYEGIGVRMGDVLVAASGNTKGLFGVAAYQPKGDDVNGIWGTTQTTTPGKEVWSLAGDAGAPKSGPSTGGVAASDGKTVNFGGDVYELKENKSAPGQSTSELREYLQAGEDWNGYRKLVGLRMQNVKGADAATLAKATLEQVQKQHPNSFVKEVKMEAASATMFFILVKDNDVEFNLWNYRKTASGVASAQFVLRNKPPFETQKKFKAEQDKNYDEWLAEIEALGGEAERLLAATAGIGVSQAATPVPAPAPKAAMSDADLAKAIAGDLEKCGTLAQKFITLLEAGKVTEAVALMSDYTFTNATLRADFVKKLEKSNQVFGKVKKYTPDRKRNDFGVKEGIMTFTLQADAQYENALVRETFSFARNEQGGIEFTGYNRTAKE
ncbi:MAG: hypothetical protein ACAI34_12900 [Verrucomicrobium sp.]